MSLLRSGAGSASRMSAAFERTVKERGLIRHGARILVAVSGGRDSVCLLHLLHGLRGKWGLNLGVVHFEHGLRGEESLRDAGFVEDLAASLDLSFYCGSGDVRGHAKEKGVSCQEAARALRYRYFREVLDRTGFDRVATAHTADDQAEEHLMRVLRGSGLSGLSGIPWERDGWIVRPLLGATRGEISGYLAENRLVWREDRSNQDVSYLRNRVRHLLIPFLEREFNPSVRGTVLRSVEVLQDDEECLEGVAREVLRQVLRRGGEEGVSALGVTALRRVHRSVRRRVYRQAISAVGSMSGAIRFEHIDAIDRLVGGEDPSAWMHLPGGGRARRCYDLLLLEGMSGKGREVPDGDRETVLVHGTGRWAFLHGRVGVDLSLEAPPFSFRQTGEVSFPRTLWLDPAAVDFPVTLRTRLPGDRFMPLGMDVNVKLKDFLISRRIPRQERDSLPILESRGEILAVAGVEISERCRLHGHTGPVLSIRWVVPGRACS